MAEDKRQTRGIRISSRTLAVIALLAGIILLATVLVVPRYGKVFSAYRAASKDHKAAEEDLSSAQQTKDELTAHIDEMKELSEETDSLMNESFKLAAQLEQDITDGKSDKKLCYITVDDGPYKKAEQFLDIFDKYDVKATFFLTTANGDKLPDQADETAKSMYPEYLKHGHVIGNHTYSHNYRDGGIYSSSSAFMESVDKQQKFTQEATGGYTPRIVRFPGGTSMAGSRLEDIEKALREEGLVWANWTVDSGDSYGSDRVSTSLIKNNVKAAADKQDIMVILFHEWSKPTLEAMPEIIEYLQDKGYIFIPLFPESMMVKR